LAVGESQVVARALSSHAATTLWLLQQFLPLHMATTPVDAGVRITLAPAVPGTAGV
jgi:hypothetical protein